MADVEFKWDREGAERLLESTGPILKRKADAVAAAASLHRPGAASWRLIRDDVLAAKMSRGKKPAPTPAALDSR